MPNLPMLRQVLDDARNGVFKHDQGTYFDDERSWNLAYAGGPDEDLRPPCGTAMCIAGWTAWRAGWRPTIGDSLTWEKDGATQGIGPLAGGLLDLDYPTYGLLFQATNTRCDLERMYSNLAAGRHINDNGEA